MYIVVRTKPRKKFDPLENVCRLCVVPSGTREVADAEAHHLAFEANGVGFQDRFTYWTVFLPTGGGYPQAVSRNGKPI